jgi:hypothetical protein
MLDSRSTPRRRRRSGRFRHSTSRNDPAPLVFAPDIGTQKMERDLQNTDTPGDELPGALEQCVQNSPFGQDHGRGRARNVPLAGGDSFRWSHYIFVRGPCQTDNIKRTFDREPFIEEFVGHFQEEEKPLPESEANDLRYNEYQAAVFSRRSDSARLDSSPCV